MKTIKSLFILFILFNLHLSAQNYSGLKIEYNLFTDDIIYSKNGEIIDKPSVSKNENIYVVVREFNPYITKAIVEVDQISYNQSSNALIPSDFTSSGLGGFSFLNSHGGDYSTGSDISSEYEFLPSSRGAASEEAAKTKNAFSNLTSKLEKVESNLNESYKKLKLFEQANKSRNLAIRDIGTLKTNPNIRPSRIKELIEEEIQYAFAKQKHEKISIDDLIDETKKKEEIKLSISNYENAQKDYQALTKEWTSFSKRLNVLSRGAADAQTSFIHESTDSILNIMHENVVAFEGHSFSEDLNYFSDDHQVVMSELRQVYEELQGNSFEYTFPPIQADGDEVVIDIAFAQINELNTYENYKNLKQTVPVSGGFKITGGVGMAFGGFMDQTYQYSVVNGEIIADEKDDFIPVIASFAHFYKQSLKNVNVGGSFGVGLPILGGNSIQSASFFLGPTVIIGQKQRFLLTGGVMGSKAERLASGFEPGDFFDGFSEILPLTQKYELGYFVAISFNVF